MDNIDSGDIDLDSIADAHQRMLDAYKVAELASKPSEMPKSDSEATYEIITVPSTITKFKYVHPNQANGRTNSWFDHTGILMVPKVPSDLSYEKYLVHHQGSSIKQIEEEQEKAMNLGFNNWDDYFKQKATNDTKIKHVHPNWVSANQMAWMDNGVLMIPRVPDELKFEAHPGWYEIRNMPEEIPYLTIEQENAMACGAKSWEEYFEMQGAQLDKPKISGASTLLQKPLDFVEPTDRDIFPPGLHIKEHPGYALYSYNELCIQQREAFELNCRNWAEYMSLKEFMVKSTQVPKKEEKDVPKKPAALIPLTGVSNIYTSRPTQYRSETPDSMGAVTRSKADEIPAYEDWDFNNMTWKTYSKEEIKKEAALKLFEKFGDNKSWDSYTKEDHQAMMKIYGNHKNSNSSEDEDPRGKVHKPSSGKTNPWEAHAWPENSDEEYNVGIYDNYEADPNGDGVEFVDSDDDTKGYGEALDAMERNASKSSQQNSNNVTTSTKEYVVQILERMEEVAVVAEAISGDSKEISREVAELSPLVTDTNEDVRNLRDDIKKINARLTAIESSLNKLAVSTTSLNSMMEIIVTHFTKEEDMR